MSADDEKPLELVEFPAHQARCARCRASNEGADLCEDGAAIFRLETDLICTRALLSGASAESQAVLLTATIEHLEAVKARERGGSGN